MTGPEHFSFCSDPQLHPWPSCDGEELQACRTCGRLSAIPGAPPPRGAAVTGTRPVENLLSPGHGRGGRGVVESTETARTRQSETHTHQASASRDRRQR
jgi:hypothetical protein